MKMYNNRLLIGLILNYGDIMLNKEQKIVEAGKRALQEAKDRQIHSEKILQATELGGRDGPEPTRYGDWEKKGIISDF